MSNDTSSGLRAASEGIVASVPTTDDANTTAAAAVGAGVGVGASPVVYDRPYTTVPLSTAAKARHQRRHRRRRKLRGRVLYPRLADEWIGFDDVSDDEDFEPVTDGADQAVNEQVRPLRPRPPVPRAFNTDAVRILYSNYFHRKISREQRQEIKDMLIGARRWTDTSTHVLHLPTHKNIGVQFTAAQLAASGIVQLAVHKYRYTTYQLAMGIIMSLFTLALIAASITFATKSDDHVTPTTAPPWSTLDPCIDPDRSFYQSPKHIKVKVNIQEITCVPQSNSTGGPLVELCDKIKPIHNTTDDYSLLITATPLNAGDDVDLYYPEGIAAPVLLSDTVRLGWSATDTANGTVTGRPVTQSEFVFKNSGVNVPLSSIWLHISLCPTNESLCKPAFRNRGGWLTMVQRTSWVSPSVLRCNGERVRHDFRNVTAKNCNFRTKVCGSSVKMDVTVECTGLDPKSTTLVHLAQYNRHRPPNSQADLITLGLNRLLFLTCRLTI